MTIHRNELADLLESMKQESVTDLGEEIHLLLQFMNWVVQEDLYFRDIVEALRRYDQARRTFRDLTQVWNIDKLENPDD